MNVILRAKVIFRNMLIFEQLFHWCPLSQNTKTSGSLKRNKNPNHQTTIKKRLQTKHVPFKQLAHPGDTSTVTDKGPRSQDAPCWHSLGRWASDKSPKYRMWKTVNRKHTLNAHLLEEVETSNPLTAEWNNYTTGDDYCLKKEWQVSDFYSSILCRSGILKVPV